MMQGVGVTGTHEFKRAMFEKTRFMSDVMLTSRAMHSQEPTTTRDIYLHQPT